MRHLYLEKYYKRHFVNILVSQFVYEKSQKMKWLFNITNQVFVRGTTSTHFLYLFLLTKNIAGFRYYSHKTKLINPKGNEYRKEQKMLISYINFSHQATWKFLTKTLYPIIRSQPVSESPGFKFIYSRITLTLWDLPLGYEMTKLLSEQQYIAKFPLHILFRIEGLSLFNKLYIFKALKFINLPRKFNGLN